MITTTARRRRWASGLVVLAFLAAGCTGEDGAGPEPAADGTAAPSAAPAMATTATLGEVTGRLAPAYRRQIVAAATSVVDGWIDGAFLAVDYPRASFPEAFAGFTPAARREAERDASLTTNAGLGERIEAVQPVARVVRIDVLADRRRPQAVTARIRLVFRTEGEVERRVTLRGRLYLTQQRTGGTGPAWRIFAYDLARGER